MLGYLASTGAVIIHSKIVNHNAMLVVDLSDIVGLYSGKLSGGSVVDKEFMHQVGLRASGAVWISAKLVMLQQASIIPEKHGLIEKANVPE